MTRWHFHQRNSTIIDVCFMQWKWKPQRYPVPFPVPESGVPFSLPLPPLWMSERPCSRKSPGSGLKGRCPCRTGRSVTGCLRRCHPGPADGAFCDDASRRAPPDTEWWWGTARTRSLLLRCSFAILKSPNSSLNHLFVKTWGKVHRNWMCLIGQNFSRVGAKTVTQTSSIQVLSQKDLRFLVKLKRK